MLMRTKPRKAAQGIYQKEAQKMFSEKLKEGYKLYSLDETGKPSRDQVLH